MKKKDKKWVILCSTAVAAVYAAGYITTESQAVLAQQPVKQVQKYALTDKSSSSNSMDSSQSQSQSNSQAQTSPKHKPTVFIKMVHSRVKAGTGAARLTFKLPLKTIK